MNNIVIEIKGKQKYPDRKDWEVTEFTTEGVFEKTEEGCHIVYDESEMIGAADVKSELWISGEDKAELMRTGPVNNRITIEKSRRHSCFYSTPEGDFTIGIFAKSVNAKIKELNGEIYMHYTIDINGNLLSENKMEIKIKEIRQ